MIHPVPYPDKEGFLRLSQKGNLIPVYREILGDLETPVSAYLKLARKADYSFLLESVEGKEKVARFSFLARDPQMVFRSKHREAELIYFENGKKTVSKLKVLESPFAFLREILGQYRFVDLEGLPPFCGGMVGYIGYDAVRFMEDIPESTEDNLALPDILLILARDIVIFDHLNHTIKIVSCVHVDEKASRQKKMNAYRLALKKIEQTVRQLDVPLSGGSRRRRTLRPAKVVSNFSEAQFKKIVTAAKRRIAAGEIIQVVLSQRFGIRLNTDPFNVYRALRSVNPSPYMYHLRLDDIHIIGSSPELLVRCEDQVIETRPIAGTRPRGATPREDERNMADLLNDPKERAEHIMLVDLGRNDLGRVAQEGTVQVSQFMSIEKYSHVMHIVSNVKGLLRKDKDIFDVLQAAFPAGTVTGAPKIRAMKIIDKLERHHRGPYAGCIAYFSFSGNLDSCITIRTVVMKGRRAFVQAGAGIVADSKPKTEYQETVNKAKAQIRAIEMAHQLKRN